MAKKKDTAAIFLKKFESVCISVESGVAVRRSLLGIMSVEKFYSMINENPNLAIRYARACEIRADNIFEDILNIADDNSEDVVITDEGIEKQNSEFIQRSKLRVDARKWILSKMNPKKYGEKMDLDSKVEHSGEVTMSLKDLVRFK